MKLKDLKMLLDSLTEDELEHRLIYLSDTKSGVISEIKRLGQNLYDEGSEYDDPMSEEWDLLADGYTQEEIDNLEPIFNKNDYYIDLDEL